MLFILKQVIKILHFKFTKLKIFYITSFMFLWACMIQNIKHIYSSLEMDNKVKIIEKCLMHQQNFYCFFYLSAK